MDEMTMRERIALAIMEGGYNPATAPAIAEIVLDALREPSEGMIHAGVYATAPNITIIPADSATRQAEQDMLDHARGEATTSWQAMIDAAKNGA